MAQEVSPGRGTAALRTGDEAVELMFEKLLAAVEDIPLKTLPENVRSSVQETMVLGTGVRLASDEKGFLQTFDELARGDQCFPGNACTRNAVIPDERMDG